MTKFTTNIEPSIRLLLSEMESTGWTGEAMDYIGRALRTHEAILHALKDLLHQVETNGGRESFVTGPAIDAISKAEGK